MTEEIKINEEKVLVLCATGKMGYGVVTGLKAAGYGEVYGTTRGSKGSLEKAGVKPIIANYIVKADVERAIKESGAKNLIFLTDFFKAAKSNGKKETEQGKLISQEIFNHVDRIMEVVRAQSGTVQPGEPGKPGVIQTGQPGAPGQAAPQAPPQGQPSSAVPQTSGGEQSGGGS